MKRIVLILTFVAMGGFAHGAKLGIEKNNGQRDDMWIIHNNNQVLTCYRFGPGQKYPYFFPVNAPRSGLSVTTDASLPYPHHRSLWFGCDRVNGYNFWQEGNGRGQIISQGPKVITARTDLIHLHDTCLWQPPNAAAVMKDERDIIVTMPSDDVWTLDFTIVLIPLVDVHIAKSNHSLFSARMHPTLSVTQGGHLVNAVGQENEKGTAGQAAVWCHYYGIRGGETEGLAILDHPDNLWYPSKWFTRDYGFFSPTNMNFVEEGLSIKQGETLKFKYRVVVHSGSLDIQACLADR
jgi:hypothetical protein